MKIFTSLLVSFFVSISILIGQTPAEPGISVFTEQSFEGYTLINQSMSHQTYLINNCGEILNEWTSKYPSKTASYLSEDGRLFKMAFDKRRWDIRLEGLGGIIEVLDWDSEVLWSYNFNTPEETINHDFKLLPNGHLLIIFAKKINEETIFQLGRENKRPIYATVVKEIEMIGKNEIKVVWEWNVTDHLIQDIDENRANFGIVADHPEKVNINFVLKAYAGRKITFDNDAFHANAIDYNADLDQILLTIKHYGEIWVIDHSTTTEEAKGSVGGKSGKGGDLLFRYGNPAAHNAGDHQDRLLYAAHNGRWIKKGLPHEGNFLVYNNGRFRCDKEERKFYSDIQVIESPLQPDGSYALASNSNETPLLYQYGDNEENFFFSPYMSSATPLENGNYLVNVALSRRIFEVTPEKEIVWDYTIPIDTTIGKTPKGLPKGVGAFSVERYATDMPGFLDKDLTPKGVLGSKNPACEYALKSGHFLTPKQVEAVAFLNVLADLFNPFLRGQLSEMTSTDHASVTKE